MEKIPLMKATVTKVKPVGMGDRVCVDTASLMILGEGMLIGSQSNGLFLVHSESEEKPLRGSPPVQGKCGGCTCLYQGWRKDPLSLGACIG